MTGRLRCPWREGAASLFVRTRDAAALPPVLARLRRKAGRVIWLNPLAGWRDHATTAAAMQAALPYLDALYPANTLQALAALEPEFTRL